MTISTVNATTPRREYTASGGQTVFAAPFEYFDDADLKVYQIPSGATPDDTTHLLTLTTHYTVSGADTSGGGNVTLVTGATAGDTIIIEVADEIDRDTAFLSTGDLTIASMNQELNKLIMLNKQLSMLIERKTIQFQDTAILDGVDLNLPSPVASKLLGWNTSGDAIINVAAYAEKYYGEYAAAPATNPHTGAAPAEGDMYYDTTLSLMMVYNGATWGQINSSVATAANAVNVTDAGGYFTGTDVETILQELGTSLLETSIGPTSGEIDFSGAPSWAKKITIMFDQVSLDSISWLVLQIGPTGGVATSGYAQTGYESPGTTTDTSATWFALARTSSLDTITGHFTLTLMDAATNKWAGSGMSIASGAGLQVGQCVGSISLSGALETMKLKCSGAFDDIDGGTVNVLYER